MSKKTIKWLLISMALIILLLVSGSIFINWNHSDAYDVNRSKANGEIKIAAIGDSITYGSGLSPEETYPRDLSELLGDKYWVQNFGVRRHTAMSSADLPYVKSEEYQESLRFSPDIALIMLGSNDSKNTNWQGPAKFKEEFEVLIDSYVSNNPDTKIYLMTPPKAFNIPESEGQIDNDNVNEIVQVVKDLANERSYEMIDINQLSQGNEQWFTKDNIHPDKEGAAAIAETVYDRLAE
jgi:lysophospholipase L1-like esterase